MKNELAKLKEELAEARQKIKVLQEELTESSKGVSAFFLENIAELEKELTERKQAEQQLKESEEKYRSIFEQFQDLYYRTDMDGTLVELSPSLKPITGYEREELIGKPATTLTRILKTEKISSESCAKKVV